MICTITPNKNLTDMARVAIKLSLNNKIEVSLSNSNINKRMEEMRNGIISIWTNGGVS